MLQLFPYFRPLLMRTRPFGAALLSLLLLAAPSRAQQLPARPDSTVSVAAPLPTATADVIVRTNGDELPGRVLSITPEVVRYLTPAYPDTLVLAASSISLIRYANGTEEVMNRLAFAPIINPPNSAGLFPLSVANSNLAANLSEHPDTIRALSLVAYSPAERYQLGLTDAQLFYKPAKSVFWGTLAGTVGLPIVGGVVAVGAFAVKSPKLEELHAPTPKYLLDEEYCKGYVKQAKSAKLNKSLGGFGAGVGVLFVTYAALAMLMANAFNFGHIMY